MIRMNRRVLPLLALLIASAALAATRRVDDTRMPPSGAHVSGIVTAVSGHQIQLAGGAITIDATGARVVIHGGKEGTVAQIQPGMLVFAALTSAEPAANAPLIASTVTATRLDDASLFGPVQRVDPAAGTLTVLGRTIRVTTETSFGGIVKRRDGPNPGLGDVVPGQLVQVQVEASAGQLVATSVLLVTPNLPEVHSVRGTVKSIGTESWVLDRERGDDLTLVIDAQTKILGAPKVGDVVEALYRVDPSHAFVAISIVKFEKPPVPPMPELLRFTGTVKSIAAEAWVITRESGDQRVLIDRHSKIEPGIHLGDSVEVLAQRRDDGSLVAMAIMRRR